MEAAPTWKRHSPRSSEARQGGGISGEGLGQVKSSATCPQTIGLVGYMYDRLVLHYVNQVALEEGLAAHHGRSNSSVVRVGFTQSWRCVQRLTLILGQRCVNRMNAHKYNEMASPSKSCPLGKPQMNGSFGSAPSCLVKKSICSSMPKPRVQGPPQRQGRCLR